jgi:hypothetical protein
MSYDEEVLSDDVDLGLDEELDPLDADMDDLDFSDEDPDNDFS